MSANGGDVADEPRTARAERDPRATEIERLNAALANASREREHSESELVRLTSALKTLTRGNRAMVGAVDETGLLQEVCDIAVDGSGYLMAWVGYVRHDEDRSIKPVASSGADHGYLRALNLSWADNDAGNGPAGRSVREGRPVVVRDIARDPHFVSRKAATARGFDSAISLPLLDRDGTAFGILVIYSSEEDAFDSQETDLLEELARDLAFGVQTVRAHVLQAQAEEDLRRSYVRLEQMTEDMVDVLGRVVEARDPYTQGHEQRVSDLAGLIAVEMGLDVDGVRAVETAARLHDIGKLSVPTEILTKPGKVSPAEFNLVKEHSREGFEILKGIAFPWPIAEIVLQHHERLDGSGYPCGLRGPEILVAARIIGVADVVEAMASHRPYRAALGLAEAIAEIESNPQAYDPDVTRACGDLFRSGRIGL